MHIILYHEQRVGWMMGVTQSAALCLWPLLWQGGHLCITTNKVLQLKVGPNISKSFIIICICTTRLQIRFSRYFYSVYSNVQFCLYEMCSKKISTGYFWLMIIFSLKSSSLDPFAAMPTHLKLQKIWKVSVQEMMSKIHKFVFSYSERKLGQLGGMDQLQQNLWQRLPN